MRILSPSIATLSFALLLPIQAFSNDKTAFQASLEQFASPVNCSWLVGHEQTRGDGAPSGYSADMVKVLNAGRQLGMNIDGVVTAARKTCLTQQQGAGSNQKQS